MNHECPYSSEGKHVFADGAAAKNSEGIDRWLTCIACGERRALKRTGELIVLVNGVWVPVKPEVEPRMKSGPPTPKPPVERERIL